MSSVLHVAGTRESGWYYARSQVVRCGFSEYRNCTSSRMLGCVRKTGCHCMKHHPCRWYTCRRHRLSAAVVNASTSPPHHRPAHALQDATADPRKGAVRRQEPQAAVAIAAPSGSPSPQKAGAAPRYC
ncbi:hypothetical protein C8Q78DRAFT_1057319 [Trametes maxima]|nr:hypothetical protein C8Q78DRAFT_1057319 [Trametes maxima]